MDKKGAGQTPKDGESKDHKIESNQINVSNRKNQSFYVFISKKTFEQHEELVLHALGNATSTSVITAEKLVRNGYAEYVNLETKTIEVEESQRDERNQRETQGEPRLVKRAKLLITLKRSPAFFDIMKKINDIKLENEKAENESKPDQKK